MYAESFWITSVAFHSRKYRVSFVKRAIRRSAMLLDNDHEDRQRFLAARSVPTDDYNSGIDTAFRRQSMSSSVRTSRPQECVCL